LSLSTLVPLAFAVLHVAAQAASPVPKARLELVLVSDSIWGRSELAVSINPKDQATADAEWGEGFATSDIGTDPTVCKGTEALSASEVVKIRRLSGESQPTSGQFRGTDHRGLDLSLTTLSIATGSEIAIIVISGNPSFDEGPRKNLLGRLMAIGERIKKAKCTTR
jgi:hypothetical protein